MARRLTMIEERPHGDRGSGVAEFVMMAALLLFLLFGALQVAVYVYMRNIVQASAADGARFGASAGTDPEAGGPRATSLINAGLSRTAARRILCHGSRSRDELSGLATVSVRCRGHLPSLLLPLGTSMLIDVSGSSLQEKRP